jgi:hypothetical protein
MPLPGLNELLDVQQTVWLYVQTAFFDGFTLRCRTQIFVAKRATPRCHPEIARAKLEMTQKENLVVVFHYRAG